MTDLETVNIEPYWPAMFDLAIKITGNHIPKDNGKEFVIEMLSYGKRLSEQHTKQKESGQ